MNKDLVSALLLSAGLVLSLNPPTLTLTVVHTPALLILGLLCLFSDLSLETQGGEKLSRVSHIPALALLYLGPSGLWVAVLAQGAGSLAIALAGKERRRLFPDLVRGLAPLGASALFVLQLPDPFPQLAIALAFLLIGILLEPRRYRLRPTLLTLFCAPWAGFALSGQSRLEPWALLLSLPLLVALSRGDDNSFPVLLKLRNALDASHQRAQQSTQKVQRLSVLLNAANLMSRSLEPEKLRKALQQSLGSAGLGKSQVFLPGEQAHGSVLVPLLEGRASVALSEQPEPEQRELLMVLARIFSTCWENSELHGQVQDALEQRKRSQAMLVESSRMAAMGLVAAGVAHEVNTPLGAIQLSAELAEAHLARDPAKVKPHLDAIQRATERAQKAVARTLYYAQPLGREEVETFQPAVVIEDALELLSHRIARSQVTVEKQLDSTLLLTGERQAFFSLVFNLVLNAADASVGSGPGKVWIRCGMKPGWMVLEVEDSGPGVAPEIRSKIFEPFFTTKPSGEGTGLGLHLVRQAATLFGGRVELVQSQGRGAVFRAELPNDGPH